MADNTQLQQALRIREEMGALARMKGAMDLNVSNLHKVVYCFQQLEDSRAKHDGQLYLPLSKAFDGITLQPRYEEIIRAAGFDADRFGDQKYVDSIKDAFKKKLDDPNFQAQMEGRLAETVSKIKNKFQQQSADQEVAVDLLGSPANVFSFKSILNAHSNGSLCPVGCAPATPDKVSSIDPKQILTTQPNQQTSLQLRP